MITPAITIKKFVVTFLSSRGVLGHVNTYPEIQVVKSPAYNTAKEVSDNLQKLGGFYQEGLTINRWVPAHNILSVDEMVAKSESKW